MTTRLDVPALRRRAGEWPLPPLLTEDEAAFLARLADAVEALNAADSRHEAALGTSMEHETGPALTRARWAVIRLVRGGGAP